MTSTYLQVYVYACPGNQRNAAAQVLDGLSVDAKPPPRYEVTDTTLNAEGRPIRRGQEALCLGDFATREEALARIAVAPDGDEDRYDIDEVADIALGERYADGLASCGRGGDYAHNLMASAPGCSFMLWEDPAGEWLGTLHAYTPEMGHFTAECDSEGEPVFSADEITTMVETARGDVKAAVRKAMGKPWFDDWAAH